MIKSKKFKKWFADMFRKKLFKYILVGKQIKVQYNSQVLKKEDILFLYDVHKKQSQV